MQSDGGNDFGQIIPPAGAAGALLLGLSLQDWVWVLTIVLLLLQIPYFAWTKIINPWRTKRRIRLDDEARKRTRRVVEKLDAKREADGTSQ